MTSKPVNALAQRRFVWLLWLALLLPLAQAAAAWHVQSHWDTERTGSSNSKHLLPADRCDLCLTAAAVTGGAAASTPIVLALMAAAHAAPAGLSAGVWAAGVATAYESRAPPSLLR